MDRLHRVLSKEPIMKKAKTLEVKLRSALRLIWSRSAERRAVLKEVCHKKMSVNGIYDEFTCPICFQAYPIQMAEVDHEPPIGTLESWRDTSKFIEKMFFGPQRAICKLCHKRKTAEQRRKK